MLRRWTPAFAGVATIAFIFLAAPSYAEKDIKAQLAEKKAAQAVIVEKSKKIGTEIDSLKSKLVDTSKNLRAAEEGMSSAENRLNDLQARKKTCLENIYKDEESVGGIVTAARKYNSLSTPQLVLQSKPIDAARASLIMKSMLPALQEHSAYFRTQLNEIAKIESEMTEQLAKKTQELNEFNQKKKELAVLLDERGKIYKQTESERAAQEAAVKKLAAQAKNIEELVEKVQPQSEKSKVAVSSYKLPSSITLPVHGKIITGFGEKDSLDAKSKGVTFRTRPEAPVVTPISGTVKFAGPFQKYKQILIIGHAGGYHSLIAGLGRIDTVVGASLAAGEPVGVAEKSSAEAEIYYELRHNGEPVNPQKLTVAQKKQEKT